MPVELAYRIRIREKRENNIRSTCTDTCSFETFGAQREIRWWQLAQPAGRRETDVRLELPGVTMTRGVDTLLRFRRTMDEILRSGEGGGIKEGDVLIRQNPILFIGPFDQIAREIVRGD